MVSVYLLTVYIICCALSTTCFANIHMDPDWIDPHAWSNDQDPLSQLCPKSEPCKPCENKAPPEYLRLVNTLFDPDAFRFEKSTKKFHRTFHIHATKEQLDNLRKTKDASQIDGLISEILAQSEFGTLQLVKEYTIDIVDTIWNRFAGWCWEFSWNSNILPRSQTVFTNFSLFVVTYFICRRYNMSFLIAVFFASIYFLYEYLDYECHQRIELNEAVDFIYGKQKNPCVGPARGNWFDWVMGRDSRTLCREYLSKQTRTRKQCGIVDLFHEFTINVLLKQLKLFIMSISELVQSISTTNGILITAVTLYFMKDILTTIIHSVFKFVLNPTIWSRVVSDLRPTPTMEATPSTNQLRQIQDDNLRDANLSKALDIVDVQLKLLLTQKSTQAICVSQPSAVEILPISETTEPNSTKDISQNSSNRVSEIDPVYDEHEASGSNESTTDEMTENNVNIFVVDRSLSDFNPLTRSSSQSSSVFVVDRSRSEYILYPPIIGNSTDPSDKSSSSDSSKIDSDIEFVPNLSTSTTTKPNLNSS